ncbi:TPA: PLP-dependent aminotransferase family protein, partial [Klebsiella pneumoniae]
MNIPDEGFFTLLTQGMRNRTVETLQRALYHTLRDAILQGTQVAPLASCRQEAGQMPPVVLPERLQRLPAAM